MKILYHSDLHASGGWFVPAWGEAVVSIVNEARPDITVVTGDLTMEGRADEYERARRFLSRIQTGAMLVVPGNHDARNGGSVRFEETFGTRHPVCESDSLVGCGSDCSQPDADDGRIGRSDLAQVASTVSADGKLRIPPMHHHPVPVPENDRDSVKTARSEELLKLCAEAEIDLVLAGHGHVPHFRSRGRTHFVTADTATLW